MDRDRRPMLGHVDDATLARAGLDPRRMDVVDGVLAVMDAMTLRIDAVAADLRLNRRTLLALMRLDEPCSQLELSRRLGCDPSYVTSIVDRLEELGAARRVRSAEDRRVKLVALTERGQQLRTEAAVLLLTDVPATAGLDAVEVDTLAGLLGRLRATRAARPGAGPSSSAPDGPVT